MKDWLVRRLTPRKFQEPRWIDLSSALQGTWEESFDPELSRLQRLRSYYQADEQDLARMLLDLGDTFSVDTPKTDDKPIAVAWRRLELEYKDLELILFSVFRRHFGNLPTTWFPIFAPLDETYGMTFVAAQGPWPELKNIPPDGMFLTSRGRLGTDFGHLLQIGMPKATFLEKAVPLLKRTKPLHIVYDGPLFYIRFDIPVELDFDVTHWTRDDWMTFQFTTIGGRFDYIPADQIPVDLSTMSCWWDREDHPDIPFAGRPGSLRWHLDWHIPEGFDPDWLPLDFIVAGLDGEESFARLFLQEHRRYGFNLDIQQASADISFAADAHSILEIPELRTESQTSVERKTSVPAFNHERRWGLDLWMPAGFPETWLPLDVPIPRQNAREDACIPLVRIAYRDTEDVFRVPLIPALTELLHDCEHRSEVPFTSDIQTDLCPVKTILSMQTGMKSELASRSEHSTRSRMGMPLPPVSLDTEHNRLPPFSRFEASTLTSHEPDVHVRLPFATPEHHLDLYPCFDRVPADFCPLDMPVGGSYA